MKRLLATLILVALVAATPYAQFSWSPVAVKVEKSLAFLAVGNDGSCTAFSINRAKDYVLTANHCFGTNVKGEDLLVDNTPAVLVSRDQKHDLMVLAVAGLDKPAIHLAKTNPEVGDQVASYGFGLGLERPLFRVTYVSSTDTVIDGSGLPDHLIAVDAQFVPGQSGGPVVDSDGNLVMMVEAGGQGIGLGPGVETIKKSMGRYFETAVVK